MKIAFHLFKIEYKIRKIYCNKKMKKTINTKKKLRFTENNKRIL